jgi:hypothetical protein
MRTTAAAAAVLATLLVAACAGAARADDDPFDTGSHWLTVRAGYAKNGADAAGNGGAGYGIGVSHMLKPYRISDWQLLGRKPLGFLRWTFFKQFALGLNVHHDVVSRFGSAYEVDVPATVELVRHFRWNTPARPYLGVGTGPYFRKAYHTGADFTRVEVGTYLTSGMNLEVAPGQLLGFDVRYARLDGSNDPPDPVFGPGTGSAGRWTVKLNYSIAN